MKKLPLIIWLVILGLITPAICGIKYIQFNQDCGGYLKQAADANTVEIALDRVSRALDYMDKKHLTGGYTSVIYRTEDENIGFWYTNVKACKHELESCLDGTQLEKSNVLMKVRESLTDNGEKGTELTVPAGIHKYPSNTLFAILNTISAIMLGAAFILCYIDID